MSERLPNGTWYGDEFQRQLFDEIGKRLIRAAMEWVRFARSQMGDPGRSRPGDYPGRDTGHLRRNVGWEADTIRLIARVGTNVLYGKFLELGTRKLAKRPWMKLTNVAMSARIKELLGKSIA